MYDSSYASISDEELNIVEEGQPSADADAMMLRPARSEEEYGADASYDTHGIVATSTDEFDADVSYVGTGMAQRRTREYDADASGGEEYDEYDADASYQGQQQVFRRNDDVYDADASYDTSRSGQLPSVAFLTMVNDKSKTATLPDIDETEVTAADDTEANLDGDDIGNHEDDNSDAGESSEEEDDGLKKAGWGILMGATIMGGAAMMGQALRGIMRSDEVADEDDFAAGAIYVQKTAGGASGFQSGGAGAGSGAANSQ